jgi:hypothetical protein
VKYWDLIADNLKKAGWNCGSISSTDHEGGQFWVVAALLGWDCYHCQRAVRYRLGSF